MTLDRTGLVERRTAETDIVAQVVLDGSGRAEISSGLPFLDHLLTVLARHSGFDLQLRCKGDLEIDDHHTVEDCALALGSAIDRALGERRGIGRFGYAYAPLDEALARAVVDLSGRPSAVVSLGLSRPMIGTVACENIEHALRSFAVSLRAALHVDVMRGENDHHRAEASFKAMALALRQAVAPTGARTVPSTKGVL